MTRELTELAAACARDRETLTDHGFEDADEPHFETEAASSEPSADESTT